MKISRPKRNLVTPALFQRLVIMLFPHLTKKHSVSAKGKSAAEQEKEINGLLYPCLFAIFIVMENILKIINEMEEQGLIGAYAISGGIAVIFYVEPILTYHLDIFFLPTEDEKPLLSLSPIYDYLKRKGYHADKEHIIINQTPVQFIPVYNDLIQEAVKNAKLTKYKKTKTHVLKAEYLVAIMLQTFRPKDKERIIKLLDEAKVSMQYLKEILKRHNLLEKFNHFLKVYYEK